MKKIYQSFEGKLDVAEQSGYIVYQGNGFYEVESFSVWKSGSHKVRLKNPVDWTDFEAIAIASVGVECGDVEGQAFYKGKWYSTDTINKIQNQCGIDWRICINNYAKKIASKQPTKKNKNKARCGDLEHGDFSD